MHVVHLPFLMRHTLEDTKRCLKEVGWSPPESEDYVESNGNSCLFAAACEDVAMNKLGFHPDSTRLAREVTVGFITREQDVKALQKRRNHGVSVRRTLESAGILA